MQSPPSIIDVMADPLGDDFGGPSWDAWRTFLAALFGLPMDDAQMALYGHHTGRADVFPAGFKEATVITGRRGGKTNIAALIAVYLSVFRSYVEFLNTGEFATIAVLAQTSDQARSAFGFTRGLLESNPQFRRMILKSSEDTILLRNRVRIEVQPASFRSVRGYSFACVICDEAALWRFETDGGNRTKKSSAHCVRA